MKERQDSNTTADRFPELAGMSRLQRVEFLARKLLVILSRGEGK